MLEIKVMESLDTLCGIMTWETYRNVVSNAQINSLFSALIDVNHFVYSLNDNSTCRIELVDDQNLSNNTLYVSSFIKEQFFRDRCYIDIDNTVHRPIISMEH